MFASRSYVVMRNRATPSCRAGAWEVLVAALVLITPGPVFSQNEPPKEVGKYAIPLESRQLTLKPGIASEELTRLQSLIKQKKTAHVIAQLARTANQTEIEQLREIGLKLLTPIGGYAWFATLSGERPLNFTNPKAVTNLPLLSLIRSIGRIPPEDKLDTYLRAHGAGSWASASEGKVKISVTFHEDVSPDTSRSILARFKATIESERKVGRGFFIVIDPSQITELAKVDEVRSVENYPPPRIPNNNRSRTFTNTDQVQADGLSGQGVVLGIWDVDEVDVAHRDLAGRVTFGEAARTQTTSRHSTHVACTMAGAGNVTPNLRGHAPQATIVSFDFQGNPEDEMLDAIRNHRIVAANNSWSYRVGWTLVPGVGWQFTDNQSFFGSYRHTSDFDALVRRSKLVVVFSAGNDRGDGPPPQPPGAPPPPPADGDQGVGKGGYDTIPPPQTAKNVITVGATDAAGNMTQLSSWGPTDDGRIKPDLMADGANVSSCDDDANNHSTTLPDVNNQYTVMDGTSMAAPAVTGITALLLEAYRDSYLGGQIGPAPLPSTIKAVLVQSARDLGNRGPDFAFGWGAVNAQGAVDVIRNHRVLEDTISQAETDSFKMFVPPGAAVLRVTLAWDDFPGPRLLNDLDLVLRDPSGNLHYPWVLDPANPTRAADTGPDHANNVEQVEVRGPITGTWEVIVDGSRAKYLEQGYSLATDYGFGPKAANFHYTAKMICGESQGPSVALGLPQGRYATVVNVHNPIDSVASFSKRVSLAFPPGTQQPGRTVTLGFDALGPGQTLAVDCPDIERRAFPQGFAGSYVEGSVVFESEVRLDVNALYTTALIAGEVTSINVEAVKPRDMRPLGGQLPDLAVVQNPDGSYARLRTDGWGYGGQLLVKVKNQGAVFSGPFDVTLNTYMKKSVSGLVKDETVILVFEIGYGNLPFDYTIELDKANVVVETNEGNNSVSGRLLTAEPF